MKTAIRLKLVALIASLAILATCAASARAAAPPVKLILSSHIGQEVNKTTKANVCADATEECQPGKPSPQPGGFEYPESTAGAPNGNVYIADQGNNRIQELTAGGEFVLMFGKEVNETKDNTPGATEAEKNICTETEIKTTNVKCKTAVSGTTAGAFNGPRSVAINASTGNVYVEDFANQRVDEYTANGQFVLMVGKEVNATKDATPGANETEKNLCTAASKNTCKTGLAGTRQPPEGTEKSTFDFTSEGGNSLDVGGVSGEVLYVSDNQRVQEFNPQGEPQGEISLPAISSQSESHLTALTVDPAGDVYLVYDEVSHGENNALIEHQLNVVHKFNPKGEEVQNFEVGSREAGGAVFVTGVALNPAGDLAIGAVENLPFGVQEPFGLLYEPKEARPITSFTIPGNSARHGASGLSFNANGELYAAIASFHELLRYVSEPVAELVTGSATCNAGAEVGSDVSLDCALGGEVNPEGVAETEVFFQYGRTSALGSETSKESVLTGSALVPVVPVSVGGLRPNETFYYQLAGRDEHVKAPEQLSASGTSLGTPEVAPRVVGAPSAGFVSSSSAVLTGELNPENASTEYFFEYAPEHGAGEAALDGCVHPLGLTYASCPGVATTAPLESSVYGETAGTFEATGLQPATVYRYRLFASDERVVGGVVQGGSATGAEGSFTTGPAPVPVAATGAPDAVGVGSATVSGTVNPDGQPARYSFELGVYAGAGTQYGIVFSGSTAASVVPVAESLGLTGLQPGTTYAYRVVLSSGYGTSYGQPVLFTTAGIPAVLSTPTPLALLAVPDISFPAQVKPVSVKVAPKTAAKQCAKGRRRSHGKCVKFKPKTAKKAKK